jgi:hypothetical protein
VIRQTISAGTAICEDVDAAGLDGRMRWRDDAADDGVAVLWDLAGPRPTREGREVQLRGTFEKVTRRFDAA